MNDMIHIISDLDMLIDKYSINAVKHALHYIDTFPTITKVYLFNDGAVTWRLNQDQFNRIDTAYAGGYGKISAIKVFRDITGCGLKEAKDAIERYYTYTSEQPKF